MTKERATEADALVHEKRFVPGSLLGSFLVIIPFLAVIALAEFGCVGLARI
ncbi:MAG: hypothetical protein O3A21_08485 [Proteobacteria bacterium]|nr:hypothetical protein [Pseudomonadota bacterium]